MNQVYSVVWFLLFWAGSGSQAGCWVIEVSVLDFEKNNQIGIRKPRTPHLWLQLAPKAMFTSFSFLK
jgi:hypothetical protein